MIESDVIKSGEASEKATKRTVKILIICYVLISLFCFLLFKVKILAIIISLMQIAFALYFYNKAKGSITIDFDWKSSKPSMFFILLIPIVVIFALGFGDITILDYSNFWSPFVVFLLLFMLVLVKFINKNESQNKTNSYISSFILGAAFSFGFTIISNEAFSLKDGEQYSVQVINKYIQEGKNTTYHFMLPPWGPISDTNFIKVDEYQYKQFQLGDSVVIEHNTGIFGIPFAKTIDKQPIEMDSIYQ